MKTRPEDSKTRWSEVCQPLYKPNAARSRGRPCWPRAPSLSNAMTSPSLLQGTQHRGSPTYSQTIFLPDPHPARPQVYPGDTHPVRDCGGERPQVSGKARLGGTWQNLLGRTKVSLHCISGTQRQTTAQQPVRPLSEGHQRPSKGHSALAPSSEAEHILHPTHRPRHRTPACPGEPACAQRGSLERPREKELQGPGRGTCFRHGGAGGRPQGGAPWGEP